MTDTGPRVLVGVADTPAGLAALRHAVTEARQRQARVFAVETQPWPPAGAGSAALPPSSDRLDPGPGERWVRKVFHKAVGDLPEDLDLEVAVVTGQLGERLAQLADRDSDLVIIGAPSGSLRGRIRTWIAVRLCTHHARCPVHVVVSDKTQRFYRPRQRPG
jgi:nucleotide-binding universal stress UspA family protein